MRWLLFIFCLLVEVELWAQQGMSKSTSVYSEDGKLQMLISYNPSCNCRTYTEYYPDGKVFAKRTFKVVDKKGEFIDGEDVTYFNDGSIKQFKLWKNALPEGRAYTNHDNGKLASEAFYDGKYKVGSWRYFDPNGNLLKEQLYEGKNNAWNSKKDDVITKYYKDGKLHYTEVLKAGKLAATDKKEDKLSSATAAATLADVQDGKKLFAMKCAACHAFDKDGYGPSLKDVTKKRSAAWLHRMITNGMKLVEEGDKDALALYNQYNKKKHLNMEYLSKQQVQALIDYLKKPE